MSVDCHAFPSHAACSGVGMVRCGVGVVRCDVGSARHGWVWRGMVWRGVVVVGVARGKLEGTQVRMSDGHAASVSPMEDIPEEPSRYDLPINLHAHLWLRY